MSLSIIAEKLDIASRGLSFQFHDGDEAIDCIVTTEVLQDLGSYHHLSFTEDEVFGVLIPELNRLATAKYRAGRLEENGTILIKGVDLLRYGFHRAS